MQYGPFENHGWLLSLGSVMRKTIDDDGDDGDRDGRQGH